jgi:hypothetical protein
MQTGTNPHLDSNAAHSPEIREDDPRHLGNLTKKMSSMNSQVSADTKYDPVPPPRVSLDGTQIKEKFVSPLTTDSDLFAELMYLIGGQSLIVIVLATIIIVDPTLRKILSTSNYGIITICLTLLLCMATIGVIKYSLYTNEINKWYPIQQYTS